MAKRVYSELELLAEDDYRSPQVEAGYRLHGGFDRDGRYISPRARLRWPAVRAWQRQLERRGLPLVDASTALLRRDSYPNFAQQRLLLRNGLGKTLWDALTVTGVIEGRGRGLITMAVPSLAEIVVDDLTETACGHLDKGLLKAHGLDEGGDVESGIGGHDAMWFAVRDMLFGKDAYPPSEAPERISRPEIGRLMPRIPEPHEELILLLMNVLMIEVRAEAFFAFCRQIMLCEELFVDRRAAARHAAELVDRIRQDEQIHIAYLQTVISELRGFTFQTVDGARLAGPELIDRIWQGLVHYHGVTQFDQRREQARDSIVRALAKLPDGRALVDEYDALENRVAA